MGVFQYRITLDSGAFAIADNGLQLDRLIRDRWESVKTIEVITIGSTDISEHASAERSKQTEQG